MPRCARFGMSGSIPGRSFSRRSRWAGDIAFFFPFGAHARRGAAGLGDRPADSAAAGTVFFFAAVPGIPAQYAFEGGLRFTAGPGVTVQDAGGVRVVTLPLAEAACLRRLGGRVYLGERCNLYLDPGSGALRAIEDGPFAYRLWGRRPLLCAAACTGRSPPAVWTLTPCPAPFSAGQSRCGRTGAERRAGALVCPGRDHPRRVCDHRRAARHCPDLCRRPAHCR